jgi:PIN domain nuclease of toxin-antitoxin system
MRILLDAHALIWWLGDDRRLPREACRTVETAEQPLMSAGTLMEIAIKCSLGKLETDDSWPEQVQVEFDVLSHITGLQSLPYLKIGNREHRDPFDRLLAAQALAERIPVVTRDPAFTAYGVATIW